LYLKHLLRGVSLGLFDETAAMEKFTKWNAEHDALVAKRQSSNHKARMDRSVPVVKKVEAPVTEAEVSADADAAVDSTEETKTEE
jgi:small subunit ribosomal protein S16